jgi:NUMOD3 motif
LNNIYTKIYPYVYVCTHKITGHYYIGYRSANTMPSDIDLPKYKTSSLIVRPDFENYNWQILAEFFDSNDAYDFEQQLISENWNDPLLLNEQHRYQCNGRFKSKPGRIVSNETKEKIRLKRALQIITEETKEKMRKANAGRIPWNAGVKTGPMSQENKQKISQATTGRVRSAEHCKKLSDAKKGSTPWNKGKTGGTNSQKGIPKPHQSGDANPAKRPEIREKIAQAKREYWAKKKAQALHLG